MKKIGKMRLRLCALGLVLCLLAAGSIPAFAAEEEKRQVAMSFTAKSVLLIEQQTGQLLFEQNAREALAPASLTKLMDLLLIFEALEDGTLTMDQTLTCSAYAKTMGGSEIWLKEGEQMTVEDLLKALIVASANDAAVVFAEALAATEEAFVQRMNDKAQELGLVNTHYVNCTGFDEDGHYTCAQDVATLARELMVRYGEQIIPFSTIWMDSLRGGETELVNTNRLVRFYDGTTGLKTGTTDAAGHCLCATATRDGMDLIAVVMGCKDSDTRFEQTKQLLDYGFSSFMIYQPQQEEVQAQLTPVPVVCGAQTEVLPQIGELPKAVVRRDQAEEIEVAVELVPELQAPVLQGDSIGTVSLIRQGETLSQEPLTASQTVERMTFAKSLKALLRGLAQVQG